MARGCFGANFKAPRDPVYLATLLMQVGVPGTYISSMAGEHISCAELISLFPI